MGNATARGLWCICYCSDGVDTFSVNKFLCRVFQNPLVGSPCMSSMSIEPTANELDLKEEVWQLSISSLVVHHLPISDELTVISGCLQWVTIQLSSPTLETFLLKWPCEHSINKHSVCWVKPFFCMTGDGNNFVVFGGGRSAVCTCAFQTEGNMYSYILQSQWRFYLFLHSFCAICTFFLMIHMYHILMRVHNHCRFENGCFCTSFVKKMFH